MDKSPQYRRLKDNREIVEKAMITDFNWIAWELSRDEVAVLTVSEFNDVTNPRCVSVELVSCRGMITAPMKTLTPPPWT
jgi:hypothetical protein